MSNPYFQFKQFTIYQDQCAMKVGTDGVLLGAWVEVARTKRVLDIGTGTGLIALMVAQRSQAQIDAIEIDPSAAQQAENNIARSPWHRRVHLSGCSLQQYQTNRSHSYDLLVSNPPFFAKSLKSQQKARLIARHNDLLTPHDLLQASQTLLPRQGRLAVIYPIDMAQNLLNEAEAFGLLCCRKTWVKPKQYLPAKRLLLELVRADGPIVPTETVLILENETRHSYTTEFIALVKDFYLKF